MVSKGKGGGGSEGSAQNLVEYVPIACVFRAVGTTAQGAMKPGRCRPALCRHVPARHGTGKVHHAIMIVTQYSILHEAPLLVSSGVLAQPKPEVGLVGPASRSNESKVIMRQCFHGIYTTVVCRTALAAPSRRCIS